MTNILKRLVVKPPLLYRLIFPEAIWRLKKRNTAPVAYLSFDDGPIPEQTPWVLDTLDRYGVKATFFVVGDNVRRHPDIFDDIRARGHSYGNHTMHHLQGMKVTARRYLRDVAEAHQLIGSPLFRPPHGLMRWAQARVLKEHFNIIMYDIVTRDYARYTDADEVFDNVSRHVRNGSIIVFHDSLKSGDKLRRALPRTVEWLLENGYDLQPLPM